MEKSKNLGTYVLAISIALGLFLAGFFIYKGLKSFSDKDRYVSVRGLAEQEVVADYANLKIKYTEGDSEMQSLLQKIEANNSKVVKFLKDNGLTDAEISIGVPVIKDKLNTEYGGNSDINRDFRYFASVSISVLSKKVQEVRKIELSQFDLFKQGVKISAPEYYDGGSSNYTFTKLNDIKPKMIQESTKNARIAGEQFASDSKSKLGGIKSAYQGQFEITNTDDPLKLKVRVVSSISFYLQD